MPASAAAAPWVVVVVVVVVVGVGVRASGLARVFVVAAEVREPSLVGAVVPARATRRHGVRASDAAEEPGVAIAAADARESVRGRAESRPQADVRLALRCPVVVVSSHARDERRDAVRHGHQRERRHHPSMAPTPAGDLARTHQADARANHHGRLRPRTAGRCWFVVGSAGCVPRSRALEQASSNGSARSSIVGLILTRVKSEG